MTSKIKTLPLALRCRFAQHQANGMLPRTVLEGA
jgi:hypothetical protein